MLAGGSRGPAFLAAPAPLRYKATMPIPEHRLLALERALGRQVQILWTENRRVYLSFRPPLPPAAAWTLRLHRSFQDAPEPVWASLCGFLETGRRSRLKAAAAHFAGQPRGQGVQRSLVLRHRGRQHDLGDVLREVGSSSPFAGLPAPAVTWGPRKAAGQRCVRLGSYRPAEGCRPAVLRVHPVLDEPRVPAVVVASVVHHELVHHVLTCRHGAEAGRRHGAAFRHYDALFAGHRAADRWLREELRGGACTAAS